MREVMLKLTMNYKMTKHMLNSCTLKESRTWLLVCTRHFYFIPFNHEHPVFSFRDGPPCLWSGSPEVDLICIKKHACILLATGPMTASGAPLTLRPMHPL